MRQCFTSEVSDQSPQGAFLVSWCSFSIIGSRKDRYKWMDGCSICVAVLCNYVLKVISSHLLITKRCSCI